jgi:hypothetical protein
MVSYAKQSHAFTAEDYIAMMDFFDKHLLGKKIDFQLDRFPQSQRPETPAFF